MSRPIKDFVLPILNIARILSSGSPRFAGRTHILLLPAISQENSRSLVLAARAPSSSYRVHGDRGPVNSGTLPWTINHTRNVGCQPACSRRVPLIKTMSHGTGAAKARVRGRKGRL